MRPWRGGYNRLHALLPLPRRGLPDEGKPDGIHNRSSILLHHFKPLSSTHHQSLPLSFHLVKRKRTKNLGNTMD
jgi:hypothetical protein